MEMKRASIRSKSACPPLAGPYPWLVNVSDGELEKDHQMFCAVKPSMNIGTVPIQKRQIPEWRGNIVVACCHGWLVMSHVDRPLDFVLWNPVTLESIHLPPLILKLKRKVQEIDFHDICLTSPPEDPDSMFLLFRHGVPTIVFCSLRDKRWSQRWYARQIKDVSPQVWDFIGSPVSCNGKVYAITTGSEQLVMIDIVKPNNTLVVRPLLCKVPHFTFLGSSLSFLVESCGELLTVYLKFRNDLRFMLGAFISKLNFSTMTWEEVENTKDRVFFLDHKKIFSFSCRAVDSQTDGGRIHLISTTCDDVYSYNMEDKTVLACAPFVSNKLLYMWIMPQSRDVYGEPNPKVDIEVDGSKYAETGLSSTRVLSGTVENVVEKPEASQAQCLPGIPYDILSCITNLCTPVDCLNFRATSKLCRSVVPSIPWKTDPTRLQTCSLICPWLVFPDKVKGILVFVDPKLGDRFYIKILENVGDAMICSSRFGWLLIAKDSKSLLFLNPFTRSCLELPELLPRISVNQFLGFGFSSPPTSSDCVVTAFTSHTIREIHFTSPGLSRWRKINVGLDIPYEPSTYNSPIVYGRDFHVLDRNGKLGVFKTGPNDCRWEILVDNPPKTPFLRYEECFLVECDNDLLAVCAGRLVEVFKLNRSDLVWDKVNSLGKHMIFVCPLVSFSTVAKIPEMENKIYFPRYFGSNIIFYSLDTCKFHTFGSRQPLNITLYKTKEQLMCGWIEPSWIY